MRRYFSIALLFFAVACDNTNNANNTPNDSAVADTTSEVNPLAGEWVKEGFIDTIKARRSPKFAEGSEFFFHMPERLRDTGYTYVYHEGGAQFVCVRQAGKFMINWFEGSLDEISPAGPGRIKIGDSYYRHLDKGVGVPEMVLFAGDYLLGDRTVRFTATGEINGLDTFRYYSVQTDYNGPGMDVDFIDLGRKRDERVMHSFEFKGDTLSIYTIRCLEKDENGDCMNTQKGELKYQLVRK